MLVVVLALSFLQPTFADQAQRPTLLVYAAASLTNVLEELGKDYTAQSGQAVEFSFASSAALARQVAAGATPDIFLSADTHWMDYLADRKALRPGTRIDLLGNRLVLIAPADSKMQLHVVSHFPLRNALGERRLAIGDPDSVPAGRYARSALMSLGVWNGVADKLVFADSVRTALAFVDRGEAPLGIVYATDASIDKHVRVVDTFPANSHPAIVYPLALTADARTGAQDFVAFLRDSQGDAVFRRYGFTVPTR